MQKETILMNDGRFVDFPARIRVLTSQYTESKTGFIRLDFRSGATRTYSLSPDTILHLAIEGAERNLRLAMSGISDNEAILKAAEKRAAKLEMKIQVSNQ